MLDIKAAITHCDTRLDVYQPRDEVIRVKRKFLERVIRACRFENRDTPVERHRNTIRILAERCRALEAKIKRAKYDDTLEGKLADAAEDNARLQKALAERSKQIELYAIQTRALESLVGEILNKQQKAIIISSEWQQRASFVLSRPCPEDVTGLNRLSAAPDRERGKDESAKTFAQLIKEIGRRRIRWCETAMDSVEEQKTLGLLLSIIKHAERVVTKEGY